MLARARTGAARILAVPALLLAVAACSAPRENSIARAVREREADARAGERDRAERAARQVQQETRDDLAEAERARAKAGEAAAKARDARLALEERLDALLAVEQELAEVQARTAAAWQRLHAALATAAELERLLSLPAGSLRPAAKERER